MFAVQGLAEIYFGNDGINNHRRVLYLMTPGIANVCPGVVEALSAGNSLQIATNNLLGRETQWVYLKVLLKVLLQWLC